MDPQATWDELLSALAEGDWDQIEDLAQALLDWLDRGGFPPTVIGNPDLGPDMESALCRAGCRFALGVSKTRWITSDIVTPLEEDHAR